MKSMFELSQLLWNDTCETDIEKKCLYLNKYKSYEYIDWKRKKNTIRKCHWWPETLTNKNKPKRRLFNTKWLRSSPKKSDVRNTIFVYFNRVITIVFILVIWKWKIVLLALHGCQICCDWTTFSGRNVVLSNICWAL